MLVLVPPTFSSSLIPQSFPLKGYQEILESDAVIVGTQQRLKESDTESIPDTLTLGEDLETRIFVSRRSEETELAPVIQVTARCREPQCAAAIANTWTEVFLELMQEVMGRTTSNAVEFVSLQFTQTKDDLARLEAELDAIEDDYEQRRDSLRSRWRMRIGQHRSQSNDLIADFKAESKILIEEFQIEKNLSSGEEELEILTNEFKQLNSELTATDAKASRLRMQVSALKDEILDVPQVIALRKAITDEALWQAEVMSISEDSLALQSLKKMGLVTEEINPVFIELQLTKVKAEVNLNATNSLEEGLVRRLKEISIDLRDVELKHRLGHAQLDNLLIKRESGLENLIAQRQLALEELEQARNTALDSSEREVEYQRARIEREIAQRSDLLAKLLADYNEAQLAPAQPDESLPVRLGSPAVPPQQPMSPGIPLKVLLACLFGAVVGVTVGLYRELDYWQT
jgi:uncharacterized protein involved in exopolysaccharide biosynthesis